jgi:hypothetical protein
VDDAERHRRREAFGRKIRARQALDGHDSPFPAFLNVVTDAFIDFEVRLEEIERRLGITNERTEGS